MTDRESLPLTPKLASNEAAPRLVSGPADEPATSPAMSTAGNPAAARASAAAGTPRRFGPLSRRLADQGLFLFRHRGLFVVFLFPPAVLAVLERRSAAAVADPGLGWLAVCLVVSLSGLAVRWAALGSAPPGASTRSLRAPSASRLNLTGMYSLCRHPVYLGNLFVLLGFALAVKSWWFVIVAALVYWLLYERVIAAEERFLDERFGVIHRHWADRTPTFWPRPGLWLTPETRFSWRTIVLREYNSPLLIASMFLFLRMIDQVVVGGLGPAAWLRQDAGLVAPVLGLTVLVSIARQVRKRGHSGH